MSKVSIIVPVYNVQKYIKACLKSIINQTYQDFEIIVVHDAGHDRSMEVASSFLQANLPKERYKLIENEHNIGLGLTRNEGLKYASGDYVFFIDSDDVINPVYVEHMVLAIEDGFDFVFCNLTPFGENEEPPISSENYTVREKKYQKKADILRNHGYACGDVYRKKIIDDFSLAFCASPYMEDVIWNTEYLLHTEKIALIESAKYYYRGRATSLSRPKSRTTLAINNLICANIFDDKYLTPKYMPYATDIIRDRRYVRNTFFGEMTLVGYKNYNEVTKAADNKWPHSCKRKIVREFIRQSNLGLKEKIQERLMLHPLFERFIYKTILMLRMKKRKSDQSIA